VWKENSDLETGGVWYSHLECLECSYIIGVDLNTPCEMDPILHKKVILFIDPQKELPDKNAMTTLTKDFGMNTLQMRKSLKDGFSIEMFPDKPDKVILKLKAIGIEYRVDGFENLREKYPFYRGCGYPYSANEICVIK